MNLLTVIHPELILILTACGLFLMGVVNRTNVRRASAAIALLALALVFVLQIQSLMGVDPGVPQRVQADSYNAFRVFHFANFIKLLSAGVGMIFVLLSWPTDVDGGGNPSLNFGTEAAEFFGLLLLSISGIFIVAGANDIVLLFLGVELASIPTYIMVSIS